MTRTEAKRADLEDIYNELPADSANVDESDIEAIARKQTKVENELMWAFYQCTDATQSEVAERVIEDREQRPTQSQVSRIIGTVDDEICFGPIESLDGLQFYTKAERDVPAPERLEILKEHIARLIVADSMSGRLLSPESADTEEEAPEFMKPLDFDALEAKRRKYALGGYRDRDVPDEILPALRRGSDA
jgi:hypothetical protein